MRTGMLMVGLLFAACGSTDNAGDPGVPVNQFDMAPSPTNGNTGDTGDTGDTGNDAGAATTSGGCSNYAQSTAAAMRQAGKKGCFELDGIVTLGTTDATSTSSFTFYAQDAAGGDFSGVKVYCKAVNSTTNKPECTVLTQAEGILGNRAVNVTGYYEKYSDGSDEFLLDTVTDTGSATPPAATAVQLTDIERSAGLNSAKYFFQKVQVNVSSSDALKMYDFSVPEFAYSSSSCAKHESGFGMIPKSVSGVTDGAACSGTTTQPASVSTTPDPHEVLIGTDFYQTFTPNSECTCLSSKTMKPFPGLVSSTTTLSGNVTGLLLYDSYSTAYLYLAPLVNSASENNFTNLGM